MRRHVLLRLAPAATLALLAGACFGGGDAADGDAGSLPRDAGAGSPDATVVPDLRDLSPPPFDAGDTPYVVEIGVAGGDGGRGFVPHEEGGPIPIGGSGQAGLTARLAIRLSDPDGDADGGAPLPESAIVELVLINALTDVVAESKPWDIPVELLCDAGACDQPLVLVEISHLAKLPELSGLPVWIELTVRDADDPTRILARARSSGVLAR